MAKHLKKQNRQICLTSFQARHRLETIAHPKTPQSRIIYPDILSGVNYIELQHIFEHVINLNWLCECLTTTRYYSKTRSHRSAPKKDRCRLCCPQAAIDFGKPIWQGPFIPFKDVVPLKHGDFPLQS